MATDKRATLIITLRDAGWIFIQRVHGYAWYAHPACQHEFPTPPGLEHFYPFPTYTPLRQLIFSPNGKDIHARTGTPWQGAREVKLTWQKAVAYIEEEFFP